MSNFKVTPWEVSGDIDYKKLIEEFGLDIIDEKLLNQLEEHVDEVHFLLKRKVFFAHRDFDWIMKQYSQGNKFYLYTGRGPSGKVHLGHLIPWILAKWLQDKFGVELWFQLTDDEKFLFKEELTLDEASNFSYENALDIIALGFDPNKTYIFKDTDLANTLYSNAIKVAKKITFSTIKATFGLNNSSNIGQIFYTSVQTVPAILKSILEEKNIPCLIPLAVDQDPHFRLSRDVLPKLGFYKPALIECMFLPSLQEKGKMSSSMENTAIFTIDSEEMVKKKIDGAFTGGRANAKLQRELGGEPSKCPIHKYHYIFFTQDENEIEKIYSDCINGKLLCSQCKKDLSNKINKFLKNHQKEREKAKSKLDQFILKENVSLKKIVEKKINYRSE